MSDTVLIVAFKEHIKGYGLISDLAGSTCYGVSLEEIDKYEKIWEEFEEDPELEPYRLNIPNVPKISIPRGTLYIFGSIREPITDDEVAEALGWVKTYEPHSQHWKTTPYWDKDGGFECGCDHFKPTTDIDDALWAIEHLINTKQITATEICEFIVNRKKQL